MRIIVATAAAVQRSREDSNNCTPIFLIDNQRVNERIINGERGRVRFIDIFGVGRARARVNVFNPFSIASVERARQWRI